MDVGEQLAQERRRRELSMERIHRLRSVWAEIVRDFFAMPQRPQRAQVRLGRPIHPPSPDRMRARG